MDGYTCVLEPVSSQKATDDHLMGTWRHLQEWFVPAPRSVMTDMCCHADDLRPAVHILYWVGYPF